MELKGPSEAEIKKIIKFEQKIDIYTLNNLHFRGIVLWADQAAIHVKLENDKTLTLMRNAVSYYMVVQD